MVQEYSTDHELDGRVNEGEDVPAELCDAVNVGRHQCHDLSFAGEFSFIVLLVFGGGIVCGSRGTRTVGGRRLVILGVRTGS